MFFILCQQAHKILSKIRKREENSDDVHVHCYFSKDIHKRHHNLSISNEVVIVVVLGNGTKAKMMRDIAL